MRGERKIGTTEDFLPESIEQCKKNMLIGNSWEVICIGIKKN